MRSYSIPTVTQSIIPHTQLRNAAGGGAMDCGSCLSIGGPPSIMEPSL